jgi:aspartyl-tRNA(Asn)/glutamyl-tRNA(Gln) amidotransferase subunit A
MLTPTTPSTAFKIGKETDDLFSIYLSDVFTVPANLAGIPGINMPTKLSATGLPIGVQLLANHFDEMNIFRASQALENAYAFPYQNVKLGA